MSSCKAEAVCLTWNTAQQILAQIILSRPTCRKLKTMAPKQREVDQEHLGIWPKIPTPSGSPMLLHCSITAGKILCHTQGNKTDPPGMRYLFRMEHPLLRRDQTGRTMLDVRDVSWSAAQPQLELFFDMFLKWTFLFYKGTCPQTHETAFTASEVPDKHPVSELHTNIQKGRGCFILTLGIPGILQKVQDCECVCRQYIPEKKWFKQQSSPLSTYLHGHSRVKALPTQC